MGPTAAARPKGDSIVDDMQNLIQLVQRLRQQGVDVGALLSGNQPAAPSAQFIGADISGMPTPDYKPFTGPGPGAIVDYGNMPRQNTTFFENATPSMGGAYVTERDMELTRRRMEQENAERRRINRERGFTYDGPGAIVDFDRDALVERRKREQLFKENPMRGLLEMMGNGMK